MEETANTNPLPEETGWAVDLNREEFVQYQLLLTRISSPVPLRTMQVIFSVIAAVMTASTVVLHREIESFDWMLALSTLAVVGICVFFWVFVPRRIKARAERTYDETLESGHSYYGILSYTGNTIEKRGREITTAIPVNMSTLFVECAECMAWINRGHRAIVLPARCMTPEAAAEMRRAADKLPPRNRRFFGRLEPQSQPVTEVLPEEPTVLWEEQITYTPEEYAAQLSAMVVANYRRRLPLFSLLSVVAALAFGFAEERPWLCIPWFLGFFALLTVMNLLTPRRRIAAMAHTVPAEQRRMSVTLTDRGLRLKQQERVMMASWTSIEHVIDRGEYVEIQRGIQSAHIPKRVITDLPAFNELITCYWKNNK